MKAVTQTIILTISITAAVVLGVWAGDRNPATESLVAEARPRQVPAGDFLRVAYEFRRYRLCPRDLQRTIYDGAGTRFDLGTQSRPVAGPVGRDSYVQPVQVPDAAAPGEARYRVIILDYCNPLHRIWPLRRVIEIPFEIVPPSRLP